jgi:hypothetical protein
MLHYNIVVYIQKLYIIVVYILKLYIIVVYILKLYIIVVYIQKFYIMLHYNIVVYSTLQVYQRSYSQIRHIPPKMSDKFESQHSLKFDHLVGHLGRT